MKIAVTGGTGFMNPLIPYIWIAGVMHLMIVGMNVPIPRILCYQENLSKVSLMVRQIFIVHSVYIILVLIGFGLLCLLFAQELAGATPLGRFLSGCLAFFWSARLLIQLFYYDAQMKKKHYWVHLIFLSMISFLSGIFLVAALTSE